MLSKRFFNAWALALLVIGVVRFIQAWMYGQRLVAPTAQLVVGTMIACFLYLVGQKVERPEFAHTPLKMWIVGMAVFAISFGLTVFIITIVFG